MPTTEWAGCIDKLNPGIKTSKKDITSHPEKNAPRKQQNIGEEYEHGSQVYPMQPTACLDRVSGTAANRFATDNLENA